MTRRREEEDEEDEEDDDNDDDDESILCGGSFRLIESTKVDGACRLSQKSPYRLLSGDISGFRSF